MSETYTTGDVFFATALLQEHGQSALVSIEIIGNRKRIVVNVPSRTTAEEYYKDWNLCRIGTPDLRGYSICYAALTPILVEMRRDGETTWPE